MVLVVVLEILMMTTLEGTTLGKNVLRKFRLCPERPPMQSCMCLSSRGVVASKTNSGIIGFNGILLSSEIIRCLLEIRDLLNEGGGGHDG